MQKHCNEFDRKPFKTSQSRSIKFAPSKNSGFTLIELLVVISIIALLSTIVLAALQDSRARARNTAKNNLVLEYVKALELYRNDNQGVYPLVPSAKCIGYATGEYCYANGYQGLNSFKTSLSNYLPNDFASRTSLIINGLDMKGVLYTCNNSQCSSYTIFWYLEKTDQKCIYGQPAANQLGNSYCSYSVQ